MRAFYWFRTMCVVAMVALAAGGCSHKKKTPMSLLDAGNEDDGGSAESDAGDSGPPDLNPEHDAGQAPPGMPAKGLTGTCAIDTNKIFTVVQTDQALPPPALGVDLINSRFAVPFLGNSDSCLDTVRITTLDGALAAPPPEEMLAIDDCAREHAPAITGSSSKWLLGVIDNRTPPTGSQQWDLWVATYDPKTQKMGTTDQRITNTMEEETAAVMITRRDGGVVVAWVQTELDGSSSVHARALDKTGKPTAVEHVVDSWHDTKDPVMNPQLVYGSLVLTTIGADGVGLGFWRHDETAGVKSEIVFNVLDAAAKPVGTPWVLTTNAGPAGSIDVDCNEEGGGIVYTQAEGTSRQIWMQLINDMGKAAQLNASIGTVPPVRILQQPYLGVDVAVTKLRSQYVVVYRALPGVGVTKPAIKLMFLGRDAGKLGSSDVSYTSELGGKPQLESSLDGRVVITWSEVDSKGKNAQRVARLPCVGG